MKKNLAMLVNMHRNWSSLRHFGVGNLRMDCMIPSRPMTSLQTEDFYQLVQAAMKVKRLETSSKERFQKKKFSRGASSSSGKRAREYPAQPEYSSATRGRRQRSNVARGTGRGASVRQGEIPECPHCHKRHLRVCRILTGGCFRCGSLEHLKAQCP